MQVQSIQNNNTTFGSTYRISLKSGTRKEELKKMASKYQNVLYPNGNQGYVRVSIRKRLDKGFEEKFRGLGFKVYQKFERHNVPKTENRMDNYIKEELKNGNYRQFGKPKK